jgi:type IV pilus assembly protein PilF
MTMRYTAVMTGVILVCWLTACSSSAPVGGAVTPGGQADPKLQGELVGPDEDAQKKKAIASRLQVGIEALKARDPERARRHITRALEIDPSSAEAHNAMALYYRFEGDPKREEEHYRKSIRYDGDYSQARNNYAVLLYRLGRYKDAIEQLEKAADDTNYDQRQLVFLNLGRSYAKVGDNEKAISALQRSLRLDTTQADTFLELADVFFTQGKHQDAQFYINGYSTRARHAARSLWLGIRIENALGNKDKVSSLEFQLEQMFRNSQEFQAWRAWKDAGSPATSVQAAEKK